MKKRFGGQIWRRIAAAVTGLALLTALTACGSKTEKQAKGQEKAEDVNIVLDWYPNAVHAFLYEAIEKGYFAEEGLNVHVQFPSNENDAISLVSAGKAEFGLYYQQDIIQMVADQGVKVKSLGAVCQSPLNIVLSLKDKNILSPKDLEGKT
ncbi:ABC transporter substrate-binding protein, partial [Stomatobaculum longum]|uniref:ABC transporter substrate-binding protein n=1 Tax=Stomatobaculum longum TaxID=796942 RepID=UPI0028EAD85F